MLLDEWGCAGSVLVILSIFVCRCCCMHPVFWNVIFVSVHLNTAWCGRVQALEPHSLGLNHVSTVY